MDVVVAYVVTDVVNVVTDVVNVVAVVVHVVVNAVINVVVNVVDNVVDKCHFCLLFVVLVSIFCLVSTVTFFFHKDDFQKAYSWYSFQKERRRKEKFQWEARSFVQGSVSSLQTS